MIKIIAHLFGIGAVALYIGCYQFKDRRGIILANAASRLFYILQYLLLGAWAGAALDLLGLLVAYPARWKDQPFFKKHLWWILPALQLPLLIASILLYQNIFSLFALFGSIAEAGALWFSKERVIRLISLLAAPCWLIYNFSVGAFGSMIGNFLAICSLLIALFRYNSCIH